MDVFDELLRGVRGSGAVFGRSVLWPPWALRLGGGAYLTLVVPMRGAGWIVREGAEPRLVRLGEAAVVRGPEPFTMADEPAAPRRLSPAPPADLDGLAPGELTGPTVLLVAGYQVGEQAPRRLLDALPPVVVVPDEEDCAGLRDYLEAQMAVERPGRQIVLDRLLDWLLVCTLRDWFDRPEAAPPGWYLALGDPVAGPALRAVHDDPARPWTTASLAELAGVSRTTFAKRFTELVGEGPVAYLTEWRMTLAADLLADPGLTVAAVARRVGYADPFGFSAAFKRVRGLSPSAHRRALLGADVRAEPLPVG
ncbi:AraC family transcriptional regulator [Allonocardiopsis opalescens]|uniref:AraC-like DNA-binding protein n=1 Tax=Allonocardiopsis opalescens TaxID=1144618 RepID=A0A2T0PZ23_9ACTN|nr:AraC family transcriptional regulator [Allonocardiopsis opalescens]PRX96778.1 AraC-like DNA-binding protein [Allonocardiopsis opalescens]